jgi:predicted ATP-grasp superfamily ATP-dependent carboligase
VSELTWLDDRSLDRPVLVIALAGLFDAASAATGAVEWMVTHLDAEPIARIDAEAFYDFQQVRPQVRLVDGGLREVLWPEIVARATSRNDESRNLVLLSGIEPQYRWRTFTELIGEIITTAKIEMVVTLGATPAQAPHTRPHIVFSSSTNAVLASRLGLSRPQYQGVTGVLGVLQATLDHSGPPSIAMRVGVPHYAMTERNPKATMALLRHLEHVTGVVTSHPDLASEAELWSQRLDAAVAADPDARAYLMQLEAHHDTQTEQQVASGEDLAADLERFLREQRGDS